jgi:hypothetical protein
MNEGQDLHCVPCDSIHETVPIDEHLSNRGIGLLWNDPSALGQRFEGLRRGKRLFEYPPGALG